MLRDRNERHKWVNDVIIVLLNLKLKYLSHFLIFLISLDLGERFFSNFDISGQRDKATAKHTKPLSTELSLPIGKLLSNFNIGNAILRLRTSVTPFLELLKGCHRSPKPKNGISNVSVLNINDV